MQRALLLLLIMATCGLAATLTLRPALMIWGIDGTANFLLTLCIVDLMLTPAVVTWTIAGTSDYSRARLNIPAVTATLYTALPAVGIVLVLRSQDGIPPLVYVGVGAFTVGVWSVAFRQARRYRHAHVRETIRLDDLGDADHLIEECRRELLDPSLSADERAAVELNLAGALVTASLGDRQNGLPEAYEILGGSLTATSAALTFVGALRLVEAMSVKASSSGEVDGHEEALRLLVDAASNAASEWPEAPGIALSARADSLALFSELAASSGDSERSERLHAEAVADMERALEMSPRGSSIHAHHTIALVRITFARPNDADLDVAIRKCRWALRRLRFIGEYSQRAEGYLTLADLFTLRAVLEPDGGIGGFLESLWPGRPKSGIIGFLWPERAPHDLARALALCMRLSLRAEFAPPARARIPQLTHLLRSGQLASVFGSGARRIGWMYRRTFAEQSRVSTGWAVHHAEQWSSWAAEQGDVEQAAEAHWCWITAAVAECRRRILQAEKERRLSQLQGLAAQAGGWLLAAGRAHDAAVAFDLGRAVLLTERMQRERAGLSKRLIDAGRKDLSDRWHDVCERMSQTDRAAYDASLKPLRTSTIDIRGHDFPVTFTSAEYAAHADHEKLLREIADVAGCEDVDASPTYDDLRTAACEGPLVYLAATVRGGSAVIVTEGSDPIVVGLSSLNTSDIEEHASRLLQSRDGHEIANELAVTLAWLWDVLMQPLVAHLRPASVVTLIPVGALSQLPIHAAGVAPNHDGIWSDRTEDLVFRYAPNARVLLRAQAAADRFGAEELQLLTVAVPDAPGYRPLPRVASESLAVGAQFTEQRTVRPSPATVANVMAAMNGCAIWHFACHGRHDPDEPLDSYLLLSDGRLTLRTIFARPAGRQRLAVLSACESAMPDGTLLDEVVSFPSALLQVGVAGVVSSQTVVGDDAAMLLTLRFFERYCHGLIPARALAEAQSWLRRATNDQIYTAFPDAYPLPADCTGRALAYWREQQRFTEPHNWAGFSYSGH